MVITLSTQPYWWEKVVIKGKTGVLKGGGEGLSPMTNETDILSKTRILT